jgi:hypothetical protein
VRMPCTSSMKRFLQQVNILWAVYSLKNSVVQGEDLDLMEASQVHDVPAPTTARPFQCC